MNETAPEQAITLLNDLLTAAYLVARFERKADEKLLNEEITRVFEKLAGRKPRKEELEQIG